MNRLRQSYPKRKPTFGKASPRAIVAAGGGLNVRQIQEWFARMNQIRGKRGYS